MKWAGDCSHMRGYVFWPYWFFFFFFFKAQMRFICHIHNYTEYNEEWNVFSAFNPSKCTHLEQWAADCAAPGEQSWTSCRRRDSNPQPWVTSGFKSNALSIRPTTADERNGFAENVTTLLTNGYSVVNGCRQNKRSNSWSKHHNNPQEIHTTPVHQVTPF